MKTLSMLICMLFIIGSPILLSAEQKSQVVYVPVPVTDPIERDKIIDKALFAQFMSVLGNFCHILINRENPERVIEHVGYIIKDVVTAADIVTRAPKETPNPPIKKLIHQLLVYLAQKIQQPEALALQHKVNNLCLCPITCYT